MFPLGVEGEDTFGETQTAYFEISGVFCGYIPHNYINIYKYKHKYIFLDFYFPLTLILFLFVL